LRAAAPVAATVGISKPAPSKPRTTEVATKASRRLMTLEKFVRRPCMGSRVPSVGSRLANVGSRVVADLCGLCFTQHRD
jgi:hypothetical protein